MTVAIIVVIVIPQSESHYIILLGALMLLSL